MKILKKLTAFSLSIVMIFMYIGCDADRDPAQYLIVASAGPDDTIISPLSTVSLIGIGNVVVTYCCVNFDLHLNAQWIQLYESTVTMTDLGFSKNDDSVFRRTLITGLTASTAPKKYFFQLSVTYSREPPVYYTKYDTVVITVLPAVAANQPPVATITTPRPVNIALPITEVNLTGTGTDPEGGGVSYLWEWVNGPINANPESSTAATTKITGLTMPGAYLFRLTVTDSVQATATDEITVTVNNAISNTNSFTIGSDNYAADNVIKSGNTVNVTNNTPGSGALLFTFFDNASLPSNPGQNKTFKVGETTAADVVTVRATKGAYYYTLAADNPNKEVVVQNINGQLYITLPTTVAKNILVSPPASVNISAGVHE